MTWRKLSGIIKLTIVPITVLTLAFGFFCTGLFDDAHMQAAITDAPHMTSMSMQADLSCCGTGTTEHMDTWSLISQSLVRDARNILILLVVSLLVALAINRIPFVRTLNDFPAHRLYRRRNRDLIVFHCLRLAFARGIIHPKVF